MCAPQTRLTSGGPALGDPGRIPPQVALDEPLPSEVTGRRSPRPFEPLDPSPRSTKVSTQRQRGEAPGSWSFWLRSSAVPWTVGRGSSGPAPKQPLASPGRRAPRTLAEYGEGWPGLRQGGVGWRPKQVGGATPRRVRGCRGGAGETAGVKDPPPRPAPPFPIGRREGPRLPRPPLGSRHHSGGVAFFTGGLLWVFKISPPGCRAGPSFPAGPGFRRRGRVWALEHAPFHLARRPATFPFGFGQEGRFHLKLAPPTYASAPPSINARSLALTPPRRPDPRRPAAAQGRPHPRGGRGRS